MQLLTVLVWGGRQIEEAKDRNSRIEAKLSGKIVLPLYSVQNECLH
jgi:hypothetical protein